MTPGQVIAFAFVAVFAGVCWLGVHAVRMERESAEGRALLPKRLTTRPGEPLMPYRDRGYYDRINREDTAYFASLDRTPTLDPEPAPHVDPMDRVCAECPGLAYPGHVHCPRCGSARWLA